jgi:hypothetical protein
MCRLAGLSDDDDAVVLAEWIATSHLAQDALTDRPREQLQPASSDDAFRATG